MLLCSCQYVSSIKLGAKVANFRLTPKENREKEIARLVGCSRSTLSREIRRISTGKGNYLWNKAHSKAMERRKRTRTNRKKDLAFGQ